MKLGFIITTCKSYFQNVEDIINDIEKCFIDKNHVLIVSAQEDNFEDYYYRGVKIIKVPYTALQLTGLVYLYENKKLLNSFNYWFVLPCTIKIGLDFNNKIIKFLNKNKEEDSIPIINPKLLPYRTMDMGILKSDFINIMGEYLMKLKLKSYDDKDLLILKKQLIYDENIILGISPANPELSTKFNIKENYKSPKYFMVNNYDELESKILNHHNANKIKETTFLTIDLVKYQRCFKGMKNLVMDCDGKRPFYKQ